jgi:hypothetical protein
MKLFNFFKNSNETDVLEPKNLEVQTDVPKSIFMDENPPLEEPIKQTERDRINFLIEFDYEREGMKDGFNIPNQSVLELKLERFKAELIKEYEVLINEKIEKIQKLNSLKTASENIDTLFAAKLILDITNLEADKTTLLNEKTQIEMSKGAYLIVENNYKIGFIQGMEKFKQVEIFNK